MILHHTIEGAGPRALLLHPVGLDLTFLQPMAALLSSRYRVMCMDLRGHGRSPLMPLADGLDEFAEDVHETLVQEDFAPCTVIGFSFGGMVAQALTLRHPSDVAALVPCACPCTLTVEDRIIAAARATDAERDGMAAVLEATLDRWFMPAFRKSGGDAAAREHLLAGDPRGWAQGWRAIAKIDTLPMLPTIRVPTLCIAGEFDKSSPPQAVSKIANAIPGARFKVIAGAPHMLFIEQPQAVAQELSIWEPIASTHSHSI
jgi:3-oxoadipate enol-lactonase